MGVREALHRYPSLTIGATMLAILVSIVVLVRQMQGTTPIRMPTQAYYSDDDGDNVFVDASTRVVPFARPDGREAVLARVFSCDGGKTIQVLYLERWSPQAKQYLEAGPRGPGGVFAELGGDLGDHLLVKRPGDEHWIRATSPEAETITTIPRCSDGKLPIEIVP